MGSDLAPHLLRILLGVGITLRQGFRDVHCVDTVPKIVAPTRYADGGAEVKVPKAKHRRNRRMSPLQRRVLRLGRRLRAFVQAIHRESFGRETAGWGILFC